MIYYDEILRKEILNNFDTKIFKVKIDNSFNDYDHKFHHIDLFFGDSEISFYPYHVMFTTCFEGSKCCEVNDGWGLVHSFNHVFELMSRSYTDKYDQNFRNQKIDSIINE